MSVLFLPALMCWYPDSRFRSQINVGQLADHVVYMGEWRPGKDAYYPVNDERNQGLYAQYEELASQEENLILGGRLAMYRYYDMDKVIETALEKVQQALQCQPIR